MLAGSIGIIGAGVLGKAIARGFMEHAGEIRLYDVLPDRATHAKASAASAEVVFVALPTPALPDGKCDVSLLDEFFAEAERCGWWRESSCYVIRSTVPVGYTQRLAERFGFRLPVLHSPEFLTARCHLTDFQIPARNIIGFPERIRTPEFLANQVEGRKLFIKLETAAITRLRTLYEKRFPGVPVQVMPSSASELVKLACNTFFAAKVTLFNLFAEIAQEAGVTWEDVRGGILSDGRIAGQTGCAGTVEPVCRKT
jgi:UDPglucose 6-dehydrogenase